MAKRDDIKRQKDSQSNLRESILEYAWGEFVRMGLKKVKVDDLADHFSISKRTLYEIFDDKENLIIECFKRQFEKNMERKDEVMNSSENILECFLELFIERLLEIKSISPIFFVDAFKYPRLMEFFNQTSAQRNETFMEIIDLCIKESFLMPHFNYRMLLEVFQFQLMNIIIYELYKKYDMHEILKTLQIVNLRGCCTQKGQQIIDSKLKAIMDFE